MPSLKEHLLNIRQTGLHTYCTFLRKGMALCWSISGFLGTVFLCALLRLRSQLQPIATLVRWDLLRQDTPPIQYTAERRIKKVEEPPSPPPND